jgi:hypothetical protein
VKVHIIGDGRSKRRIPSEQAPCPIVFDEEQWLRETNAVRVDLMDFQQATVKFFTAFALSIRGWTWSGCDESNVHGDFRVGSMSAAYGTVLAMGRNLKRDPKRMRHHHEELAAASSLVPAISLLIAFAGTLWVRIKTGK